MDIRGFFEKYDAVRTDGIPAAEQEAHVRRVWAEREEARAEAERAEALAEAGELRLALNQAYVPLTAEERAYLHARLDDARARAGRR